MGSLSRFRKAYGALKDSTAVSLAKLKSDFKDLDIAIVKATNHVKAPPKERHVQKIFAATAVIRPRADVAYCIYALSRRLTRTRNWIVAIKVLIVIHRALREGDPTFREELMNYSGHILHMANFKDDSSTLASVCSEWVRSYALYIEERLECIRILKYGIEAEQLTRDCADATQVHSRTRVLSIKELLDQLPALQELLYRIVGCQPEGGASTNYLVQYSLSLVLIESFKIYGAINDGIINLVDTYFEMPKHDAVKALGICKRAGKQAETLAGFYDFCKHLELGRNFEFPTLTQLLPSFLATMEVYIKEEPPTSSISRRPPAQDLQERDGSQHVEENPEEAKEQLGLDEEKVSEEKQEDSKPIRKSEFSNLISIDDLLGLNDMAPKAEEIEESNALALFNTSTGNDPQSLNSGFSDPDTAGWELALFSAPSNDSNNANLGSGFNKLLEGTLMQTPFQQQQDVFAMSNSIAPLTHMQVTALTQQKQQQFQHYQFQQQSQNMNMMYYQNPWHYPSNPFEDPLCSYPSNTTQQHGNDLL